MSQTVPLWPAYVLVDSKMFSTCRDCGSIVQLNKTLFGSLHLCLTPEELAQKNGRGLVAPKPPNQGDQG